VDLKSFKDNKGEILELGAGKFSSGVLSVLGSQVGRKVVTADTDKEWLAYVKDSLHKLYGTDAVGVHEFIHVPVYSRMVNGQKELTSGYGAGDEIQSHAWDFVGNPAASYSVVFVDQRPGERRLVDVIRFSHSTDILLAHDSQQPAYKYGFASEYFKYVSCYNAFDVTTSILSNNYDLKQLFD
jgi:hypothetical protein